MLKPARPFRVALLCSRRAPGLDYLVGEDPNRGRLYEVVVGVTSDPDCVDLLALDAAGIPAVIHDIRAFYRARGARLSDLGVRPTYDAHTAEVLHRFHPDLVVLSSYLHILTAPMLEAFPDRVINVHDADLTVTDATGRPRYRGLRSTRDAILGGERETRSTVHLVTAELDVGPLLVRSWPFPVQRVVREAWRWNAPALLKGYAAAHRAWMMHNAWGPLLARAIGHFAHDRVRVSDGRAYLGGAPGPEELAPWATGVGHPVLAVAGGG